MFQAYKNIYLKELALPNNPLKYLNFYIIKGEDRSMIIDTGFNQEEIKADVLSTMNCLALKPEKTILFLTHLHSDHTGLAGFLQDLGMEIYMSKVDGVLLNNSREKDDSMWKNVIANGHLQGLDPDNLNIDDHPGYKFRPDTKIQFTEAIPGENISIGEYNFEIIDLKGHTPGIVGLYEREHKLLFCGDHILGRITPNITFWGFEYGDMLGTYLTSLKKVYNMDINHLFSSHRHLVKDHKSRIEELFQHHEDRLNEAKQALSNHGKSTVRDVTMQLHWSIKSKDWDSFPKSQKWFAAGETHAHLEHLRALGEVDMANDDGVLYYSLAE
jgi:glyoxylase-like metal-dependent hydrolase (beta-lactamase superfamily II)